ncbi:hypothetical protein F2P45_13550 [Massilia sp. CCM 8733]|uniref:Uncharacterized protein n=1 Tax=Massilia mucilaginosa TaxID=2609282 RepID=A0ABX0NT96_9BURK|nr:hypothetical protein [Massilia mucilaginosa]NHZ90031.1 hypothetical protein [Massilia mucilaginosa]
MYDFANDKWPDGERIPYKLIRWRFLEQFYRYARMPENFNCQWEDGWERYEKQSQFAYQMIEPALTRPLEKLMIEVVVLLLAAGRQSAAFDQRHRKNIAVLLDDPGLAELVRMLGDDERSEFTNDLAMMDIPHPRGEQRSVS